MSAQANDDYGAAIGSVMAARKQYEAACATQGSESWAAQHAHDSLMRAIEHRNEMRKRHDAGLGQRAEG